MRSIRWLAAALLALPAMAADVVIPYRFYAPPTKTLVTVQVMWVGAESARAICKGGAACWFPSATGQPDLIVAEQPENFNDERRLMILGHEFFHALGAQHD